jgi:hypothetical protein
VASPVLAAEYEQVEMFPVDSSNLAAVGYAESSGRLYVSFKNGTAYAYFDVPLSVFGQLMQAASKGGFLAKAVKGKYGYTQVA